MTVPFLDLSKKRFAVGREVKCYGRIPDRTYEKYDSGLPKRGVIVGMHVVADDMLAIEVALERPVPGMVLTDELLRRFNAIKTFCFDARQVETT